MRYSNLFIRYPPLCSFHCSRPIGIGPFVNPYFLKSLSTIGRGYAEICLHQDMIASNIIELMRRTYSPQLTDIVLGLSHPFLPSHSALETPPTMRDVEIYPLPIPDLYAGYPATVAGKYSGNFPTTINVKGLFLTICVP